MDNLAYGLNFSNTIIRILVNPKSQEENDIKYSEMFQIIHFEFKVCLHPFLQNEILM